MANTASYASTGKPKIAGAIYAAPVGTTLPTDATTALDNAFEALGYVSEDGVTNDNSPETENIRAWGGDVVLTPVTGRDDTFSFTLIEVLNLAVLKLIYGSTNVAGTLASGITINVNSKQLENHAIVIVSENVCDVKALDMILTDDGVKRIVIPAAAVAEVGTITYRDNEAIGYETTLNCQADAAGNTHYEYIMRT